MVRNPSETRILCTLRRTNQALGRLDLVFNVRASMGTRIGLSFINGLQNAGIGSPQVPIEELSLETFKNVIDVNLIGSFLCTREAVKVFKSQSPPGGEKTLGTWLSFANDANFQMSCQVVLLTTDLCRRTYLALILHHMPVPSMHSRD